MGGGISTIREFHHEVLLQQGHKMDLMTTFVSMMPETFFHHLPQCDGF